LSAAVLWPFKNPAIQRRQRESKESPRLKAFCRVAPSVLFNERAIFPAGVFFRANAFNVRTCSDVHTRRFPFGLAIFSPSDQKPSLVAARTTKEKINFRIARREFRFFMDENQNLSGGLTATRLLGEKIIEVAERGVLDPDLLLSMALNELDRD